MGGAGGLPLSVVLWELLLRDHRLPEALELLRSLNATTPGVATMGAGAAMLLSQPGHGIVIVEWSRSELWVSPVSFEGLLVHANHCVVGSSLVDVAHQNVQKLNEDSKWRQAAIEEFYAEELLAGKGPQLSVAQVKAALSAKGVQNDSVLSTVVLSPADRALHVRFRLQTEGMELANDTVACDFWQTFDDPRGAEK